MAGDPQRHREEDPDEAIVDLPTTFPATRQTTSIRITWRRDTKVAWRASHLRRPRHWRRLRLLRNGRLRRATHARAALRTASVAPAHGSRRGVRRPGSTASWPWCVADVARRTNAGVRGRVLTDGSSRFVPRATQAAGKGSDQGNMSYLKVYLSTAPVVSTVFFFVLAAAVIEINRFFPDALTAAFIAK